MSPAITVILPTYNRARLARQAVDSILAQTFADFELLVIDDGSSDDSEVALSGLDERLHYWRIAHGGASVARNVGLSKASGAYIAFLDSDDLWQPTFLETALKTLNRRPAAGFTYTDYTIINADGQVSEPCLNVHEKINGRLYPAILNEDFICMGSLLFRRHCLEQAGEFDPDVTPAEDWDMWLRITPFFDACYIDQPLLRIRFHGQNISQQPGLVFQANLRIMRKFRRLYPELAAKQKKSIRRNCRRYHHALARQYLRNRRPGTAAGHLLKMLLAHA